MKNIYLIGCNSDIAKEIFRQFFSDQNNFIFLIGRNFDKEFYLSFPNAKKRILFIKFNIVDFNAYEKLVKKYFTNPDVVIFCQGTSKEKEPNVLNLLEINYISIIFFTEILLNKFQKKLLPNFIVISSIAGIRGRSENFLYGSTKAGLINYFTGLNNFLFKNEKKALIVVPGYVKTKLTSELNIPDFLMLSPAKLAIKVHKSFNHKSGIIYPNLFWHFISLIIKFTPNFIYKKFF